MGLPGAPSSVTLGGLMECLHHVVSWLCLVCDLWLAMMVVSFRWAHSCIAGLAVFMAMAYSWQLTACWSVGNPWLFPDVALIVFSCTGSPAGVTVCALTWVLFSNMAIATACPEHAICLEHSCRPSLCLADLHPFLLLQPGSWPC